MTDQPAEAALPERAATLPRSAAIIEAFRSAAEPADELLRMAARLARQHQEQWAAETVSRDPSATAEQIAASKRPSKIRPYLTKGSIVAFDELAHAKWPGETSALRDTLGTDACRLRLLPGHATPAYLTWEG